MIEAEMPDKGAAPDPGILAFLLKSGLVTSPNDIAMRPLTGGVASDIWKVDAKDGSFVVKKALPRLRVAQEWIAPVSRNASEVAWMGEAGESGSRSGAARAGA